MSAEDRGERGAAGDREADRLVDHGLTVGAGDLHNQGRAEGLSRLAQSAESPDTFVREAIWTLVARVKVVEMSLLLPVRAAFTVTCPTAEGEKVTVVCVLPCESVVVDGLAQCGRAGGRYRPGDSRVGDGRLRRWRR